MSVSVFQWFTANGGQLTGPWRPVEGRSNWTGTTNFWRTQIKQMMAANFDLLYVHLIPSSESQRINLFQALNQLRREGWNVPKVAPFLDPMITWHQQPLVDVNTVAGKDEFVSQYIRWFNQYYSVNQDPYADDYLARINGRPILDTWHVKFNLANLASLSRADVETRLTNAFAASHPLFTNGIYMVTTALNDPTFAWADEKVPQFEINEYSRAVVWRGVRATQLKGGYWDQNIRNPGDFLARAGGLPYSNAWSRVNRSLLSRVYVESWNEYDEGTGIYAANAGPPYIRSGSGNTNSDVWSSTNDPYEYIKTTARGAAAFNESPERDARILWHDLPTRLRPGETRTATVIVRNEGDALWSEAAKYRFGQKEFLDPVLFGAGRYLLNDAQDDIPTYGGIFRGRPRTFTLNLKAPTTPGRYTNHWSMLQENVAWFGQELTHAILVDPTPVYHGAPQTIDSTALLTNHITDNTEHTYAAGNLPVGSYADCQITRTFAAPIKSLKLFIVSGTADDVGYVGNILVTPDSANVDCQLGHVTGEINVTGAVAVSGNTASLTLRARDTCCCDTGWGEDTAVDRANARFRWEVELAPPVPFTPVFTNAANGHYYALLTPATWTWSEHVAAELGGHLTSLSNLAEQVWVFNTFASYGGLNRLLWIGINDVATEGTFRWSSGEPVGFTYWSPGEPNNALTGEDFVTMYPPGHSQAGRWNDWGERVFSGSQPFNGVVELPASKGPPVIIRHPYNQRVNPGTTVTFPMYATGSRPLRYQWRFSGTDIGWATNSYLVLTNVQYEQAGVYSVLVSDALASVASSNATLIVNHAPVATAQTVSLDEDTSIAITLAGTDADGDTVVSTLLTPPIHGQLSGVAPALTYAARPNYFGPDSFTFRVNDGLASSLAATVSINVRPVNDPPVARAQTVSVNEDTPLAITLTASDVEGDTLTYSVANPPAHGTLSGTAPNLSYQAATNYFGPDGFTFTVNDGLVDSAPALISLNVLPVNDPPVARITVAPVVNIPAITNLLVIASPCTNTMVVLDGSSSSDVEDDPLQFSWFLGDSTNVYATGVVAVVNLPAGTNAVALTVSDGLATASARETVEVITAKQAIERLLVCPVLDSGLPILNKVVLAGMLIAAEVALQKGHPGVAIGWLEAFQEAVRTWVVRRDEALAEELFEGTSAILDAVRNCITCERPRCRWGRLACHTDGRVQMHFSAPRGPVYLIEASTDLRQWERIGIARDGGAGEFEFEDTRAARLPQRFYRIVAP